MRCPKCDTDMERIEGEPDVNVVGGWECADCEVFTPEWAADTDADE